MCAKKRRSSSTTDDFSLSERKKRLLATIIKSYVEDVEPIGSRTICKKFDFNLSPATIRNEMAELEEDGLLYQPHTSAGRIPTDFGYRVFVDELMEPYKLSTEEQLYLNRVKRTANALDAILSQSANILSEVSQCIAVVQPPRLRQNTIKILRMVPVDPCTTVLVVTYSNGLSRESIIRLNQSIYPETLSLLNNYLNSQLTNLALEELFHATVSLPLEREITYYKEMLMDLIAELYSQVQRDEKTYLNGTSYLLKEPEFRETAKAYPIFSLLEKDLLLQQIAQASHQHVDNRPVRCFIGSENIYEELHNCSLIYSQYYIGPRVGGTIGILGPTRMKYSKTVKLLETVADNLSQTLTRFFS